MFLPEIIENVVPALNRLSYAYHRRIAAPKLTVSRIAEWELPEPMWGYGINEQAWSMGIGPSQRFVRNITPPRPTSRASPRTSTPGSKSSGRAPPYPSASPWIRDEMPPRDQPGRSPIVSFLGWIKGAVLPNVPMPPESRHSFKSGGSSAWWFVWRDSKEEAGGTEGGAGEGFSYRRQRLYNHHLDTRRAYLYNARTAVVGVKGLSRICCKCGRREMHCDLKGCAGCPHSGCKECVWLAS